MPTPDPNYKFSINQYTGDGSQTIWPISFQGGFISRSHVKASLVAGDGAASTLTFTWINDQSVQITPAVAAGQTFRVYRDTPKDAALVEFADGAFLSEQNLDKNARQAVLLAGEAADALTDASINGGAVGLADAPNDGTPYLRQGGDWVEATLTEGGLPEAPADGKQYVRKNQTWAEVIAAAAIAAAGTIMPLGTMAAAMATPPAIPANVRMVQTSGYAVQGVGPALYVEAPAVNSAYVAANPRSCFLAADGRGFRIIEPVLRPSMFGTANDGVTNETLAFVAMSREVRRRNGGVILLDRTVYMVGLQDAANTNTGNAFGVGVGPSPLDFSNMSGRVQIIGNGAIFRTVSGLKYGSFNPATGAARTTISTTPTDAASPFEGVVRWVDCSGDLTLEGFRCEGQNHTFVLGGEYGDTGRQVSNYGLYIVRATGRISGVDFDAVRMGLDGGAAQLTTTATSPKRPLTMTRCFFDENGRQGFSQVGGRGARYVDCRFNRTGRGGVSSAPCSGFDMEAEGANLNRDTVFDGCEFVDNVGTAMVADSGDSADATFRRCKFIGTTNWAVWANKPGMVFEDCKIIGAVVNPYPDASGKLSNRFIRCLFTDDPALSPTGLVYGPRVVETVPATGTLFDDCDFTLVGAMTLPYTPNGVRYRDCRLSQATATATIMTGTFTGLNVISAPANAVNLANSNYVSGIVNLNGAVVSSAGGEPWDFYTPAITVGSGALTTFSTYGKWKQVGKTVHFMLTIRINDNGTGADTLTATLPVAASNYNSFAGREVISAGFGLSCHNPVASSNIAIAKYDGTYPGGTTNYRLVVSGSYEAA